MVQTITNQQKQVRVREERDPSKWIEFVIKKVPFSHSLLVLMPPVEKNSLYGVSVPDPLPAGVVELVRQPLVFQELVPLGMEEQRLSTSAKKHEIN